MTYPLASIAVVGGGVCGATVARALALAGHSVQVFDKARGVGGRLATRRMQGSDCHGRTVIARVDHGALGLSCSSQAFRTFLAPWLRAGCLVEWSPQLAVGSRPLKSGLAFYLPTPDMPALVRSLLDGVDTQLGLTVDGLHRGERGWQLHAGGLALDLLFDAVVLALPPAQAAPLLKTHRPDWAQRASSAPMHPCWTLMGTADDAEPSRGWDVARPPLGPLAWVLRCDRRPGRAAVAGRAHWVAHAHAEWSRKHLEQSPDWVLPQLQAALAEYLGRRVVWQQCAVHRWRYALPPRNDFAHTPPFWWDAALGLGVCGDFLGGNSAEGAWQSAQALSAAMLQPLVRAADPAAAVGGREAGTVHASEPPNQLAVRTSHSDLGRLVNS